MKPVEQMTIEECEREVKQHNPDLETLCYTMDSADKAIRAAGGGCYNWSRHMGWYTYPGAKFDIVVMDMESPALDLWRLAVKVYRAKKGGE